MGVRLQQQVRVVVVGGGGLGYGHMLPEGPRDTRLPLA